MRGSCVRIPREAHTQIRLVAPRLPQHPENNINLYNLMAEWSKVPGIAALQEDWPSGPKRQASSASIETNISPDNNGLSASIYNN